MLWVYILFLLCVGSGFAQNGADNDQSRHNEVSSASSLASTATSGSSTASAASCTSTSASSSAASAVSASMSGSASSAAALSSVTHKKAAKFCGVNEVHVSCRVPCPSDYCPKNGRNDNIVCDPPHPCRPGCVCKPNYKKLSNENQTCIPVEECPAESCGINEVHVFCRVPCPTDYCPKNDENYLVACDPPYPCPPGCICQSNYRKLSYENQTCVPVEQCPPVECTRPNEEWNPCPSSCMAEYCSDLASKNDMSKCSEEYPRYCQPKCVCKNKFYRNDSGICVPGGECPIGSCGLNEIYTFCVVGCPTNYCPENERSNLVACDPPYQCPDGCACKLNYRRLSQDNKTCIPVEECPPVECTGPNEEWNPCPSKCLVEYCSELNSENDLSQCSEDSPSYCQPKCVCKKNFYRNDSGVCVPTNKCNQCQPHATYTTCLSACPRTCQNLSPQACIAVCRGEGCQCDNGYVSHNGECILPEQCPEPQCGLNEILSPCKIICPPQSCESIYTSYLCAEQEPNSCTPGCNCIDGYLRNSDGVCIQSEKCPGIPTCDLSNPCLPTCKDPQPKNCRAKPYVTDEGCGCPEDYILSELGGTCIKIEDCPQDQGCNGDPNAVIQKCSWSSPATCYSPNAEYSGKCDSPGCVCKSGYLLSDVDGKCILSGDCPGGDPCGRNASFSDCAFRCPNGQCPEDDSRIKIACKPGRPCAPGCVCEFDYKRKSVTDDTCILAKDCSPVECTRPNEEWNSCPRCLAERCEDYNVPNICDDTPGTNCAPQCVCIEEFYRNSTGDCIPLEECPKICPIPEECQRTCAVPNPKNCDYFPEITSNEDGCQCMPGYVLNTIGGECIPIQECPTNLGCNGDKNAVIKECPLPCPSTCDSPDATPCKKACEPVGCECAPGYMLSKIGGKCILPDDCKGGNPCGVNETFVSCNIKCPSSYCPINDNRYSVICDLPNPCLPGCNCIFNHLRKSRKSPRCIASADCPPVKCTRPNEVWDRCPSACLSESCESVNNPQTICNPLVYSCNPRCVCKENYLRDSNDICIPAKYCKEYYIEKKGCN